MTELGKLIYKMECTVCTSQFIINHLHDQLPKHDFMAERERLSDRSSCLGSSTNRYRIIKSITSGLE